MPPGWEQRLDTEVVLQLGRLRTQFGQLPWWTLAPDTARPWVTAGRGTALADDAGQDVLDNDYVTAARSADGTLAVAYLPTAHTITVDRAALAADAKAVWIDPASGVSRMVPMTDTFTAPGLNADGDDDWLLVITVA